MKLCTQITLVVLAVFAGLGYKVYRDIFAPLPLPDFDTDAYWGPGLKADHKPSTNIQPFTIQYANAADKPIEALRSTLNRSLVLPAPLEGVGFEYGVNSHELPGIVRSWRDDYLPRWEQREKFLNQFPQFTTQIQGLNVHFIHVKPTQSTGKTVVPLLLIHGWPGSVREFYEIIPKLTAATAEHDVVFEVIAPSLPGYGFSQAASKTGFGPIEMSIVLRNLMIRLGHTRFYVQGGDWGSVLGSNIATIFSENVIAYHSNFCFNNNNEPLVHIKATIASWMPSAFVTPEQFDFHFPRGSKFAYIITESGYFHFQATKPDTIGTVLTQNPVGLFAYIFEKFSTWTNAEYRELSDGGWSKFSAEFQDAILDNIMIYYLTNTITTSQRLYAEGFTFKQLAHRIERVPTGVPFGCARFKHDLTHHLDWELSDRYTNIVTSTYHQDGGHFAAMEKAQTLFEDFSKFVKKVRGL